MWCWCCWADAHDFIEIHDGKIFYGLRWHHGAAIIGHVRGCVCVCEFMAALLLSSILLFNICSLLVCLSSSGSFFQFPLFLYTFFFFWFAVKMCKMYALHRSELYSSYGRVVDGVTSVPIWGLGCRSKGQNVINVRAAGAFPNALTHILTHETTWRAHCSSPPPIEIFLVHAMPT